MHRSAFRVTQLLLGLVMFVASCAPAGTPTGAAPSPEAESGTAEVVPLGALVIYSGRSEALIRPVLDAFVEHNPGVEIVLKSGSNSELANALLEEQANPQADVFITTEVMTVQNLHQQGLFDPYVSPAAESIAEGYREPNGGWTGVTMRARVIMYNTSLLSAKDAPTSVLDLTNPEWQGRVAAAGSTNGSMQAQIAAMRELLGDETTESWLQGLMDNGVTFFGGHTDVRKAVGAGEFQVGLVNHYYYHLQKDEGSPVAVVYPDQGDGQMGTMVNATAVAILNGTEHREAAEALVDFLLSEEGQELFAQLNYEYPLVPGVPLKEGVLPLDQFRIADVDLVKAATDPDWVFDLLEQVGMP